MATNDLSQLGMTIPATTGAPNGPQNLQDFAASISENLTLIFASASDRASRLRAAGFTPVPGTFTYQLDTKQRYRWTGSVWDADPYIGTRLWTIERGGGNESDIIAANTVGSLVGGTVTAAPAGQYLLTSVSTLNCDAAGQVSSGLLYFFATSGSTAATTGTDLANQLIGLNNLSQPYSLPRAYTHSGGNLNVASQYSPSDHPTGATINATKVWRQGTYILVQFLGPTTPA